MQRGGTALFWATLSGYINIVQMMIDHGAAVDLGYVVIMIALLWLRYLPLPCGSLVVYTSLYTAIDKITP